MTAVKIYYKGKIFIPISPISTAKNQAATVTILDGTLEKIESREYLQFVGSLPDEDYREITTILQSTEQADAHEW
jgi:hypothetical protein